MASVRRRARRPPRDAPRLGRRSRPCSAAGAGRDLDRQRRGLGDVDVHVDLGRRGARREGGAAVCAARRRRVLCPERLRRRLSVRPDRPPAGDPDRERRDGRVPAAPLRALRREVGRADRARVRGRLRRARRLGRPGDGRGSRRAGAPPGGLRVGPRGGQHGRRRRAPRRRSLARARVVACALSVRRGHVGDGVGGRVPVPAPQGRVRPRRPAGARLARCDPPRQEVPAVPRLGGVRLADIRRLRDRASGLARRRLRLPAGRLGIPRLGQPAARRPLPGAAHAPHDAPAGGAEFILKLPLLAAASQPEETT